MRDTHECENRNVNARLPHAARKIHVDMTEIESGSADTRTPPVKNEGCNNGMCVRDVRTGMVHKGGNNGKYVKHDVAKMKQLRRPIVFLHHSFVDGRVDKPDHRE